MANAAPNRSEFLNCEDPFIVFDSWLKAATDSEINDPNAMSLASTDKNGMPNVRIVLLKHADEQGFVFYTNFESQKGSELLANPKAALCFHWKSLRKQVRVRGLVEQVSTQEADEYFASRPKGSQIGAWASKQSRPLENQFALQKAVTVVSRRYLVKKVDRPPYWSGLRIKPLYIEFWQDRPFRLHDRMVFTRTNLAEKWQKEFFYP